MLSRHVTFYLREVHCIFKYLLVTIPCRASFSLVMLRQALAQKLQEKQNIWSKRYSWNIKNSICRFYVSKLRELLLWTIRRLYFPKQIAFVYPNAKSFNESVQSSITIKVFYLNTSFLMWLEPYDYIILFNTDSYLVGRDKHNQ